MNLLVEHWKFDPMLVVIAATVVAHEIGLSRLAQHSRPERTRMRRRRSYVFYVGLGTLVLAIASPIDFWASEYFYIHMLEHILLSFATPISIVVGAPWLPLMFFLPVKARRRVGRFFYLSAGARGIRALGRFIRSPWVAVVLFNMAMLAWHVPALFDLAERNEFVHVWLMHGSFVLTGVLFWLQILDSPPIRPAHGAVWKAATILGTNAVMTILAMSMSVLTAVSWYPVYSHIPGVTLSPFADQQIGAAILWICGDFWAVPVLLRVLRQAAANEGSLSNVFDRLIKRSIHVRPEALRRLGVDGEAVAD